MGLANNGGIIKVLLSNVGDSWTIINRMPDGTACIIAVRENRELRSDGMNSGAKAACRSVLQR